MFTSIASTKFTHGKLPTVAGDVVPHQEGGSLTVTLGESTPAPAAVVDYPARMIDTNVLLGTFDDEAALVHQIETLERILALQSEEQAPNDKTVWTPLRTSGHFSVSTRFMFDGTTVSLGGAHQTVEQRREAKRHERLRELRMKAWSISRQIEAGRRTPTQRVFDALQRHDHDALRRAIADGADVQTRYESDDGNPQGAGMKHRNGSRLSFHGLLPLHYAVMEDDPEAVIILMDAHSNDGETVVDELRAEVQKLLQVLAERGVQASRVAVMLETRALRSTLDTIERAEPMRARARARL